MGGILQLYIALGIPLQIDLGDAPVDCYLVEVMPLNEIVTVNVPETRELSMTAVVQCIENTNQNEM